MVTEVIAGPLGEIRAASAASGGTALTTTAAFIQIPNGTVWAQLTPRNFATAVVARVSFNPYLVILKTTDDFAAATNCTEYSDEAQDASTSTSVTLSSLSTAASLDYLWVGSHLPFRGVAIDVDAANGNASVLTVNYRKNDNTWATTSATDGTASGGATLAVDGNVTWTVPTDWLKTSIKAINAADSETYDSAIPHFAEDMYWTRWQVSAALDSSTTLDHMLALNRSTAYAELVSGQVLEQRVNKGPGGIGCIEALTNAGTANLIVNVASQRNAQYGGVGFV